MKTYRTSDGKTFEANNALIAVKKLKSMQIFAPEGEKTDEDFMRNVAERSELYDASDIDTSSHSAFIASLLDSGLLEEVQAEEKDAEASNTDTTD